MITKQHCVWNVLVGYRQGRLVINVCNCSRWRS